MLPATGSAVSAISMPALRPELPAALIPELSRRTVYRSNGFRVLGLQLGSSTHEIAQRVDAMTRGATPPPHGFALDPAPGRAEAHAAGERLADPKLRLIDELFWFWPSAPEAGNDGAVPSWPVSIGTRDAVVQAWTQAANRGEPIAVHNLAVLHHALALDLQHARSDAGSTAEIELHWREALLRWKALYRTDPFWEWLAARANALGLEDGVAVVAAIRSCLPAALAAQLAESCVEAVARDQRSAGECYRRLLGEDHIERRLALCAWHDALHHRLDQLDELVSRAEDAALRSPGLAQGIAQELLRATRPALDAIDGVLGAGHPWRDCAYDAVASTVRRCVIEISPLAATREALGVLSQAGVIASDPDLRRRLGEQLAQLAQSIDRAETQTRLAGRRSERKPSSASKSPRPEAQPCFYCVRKRPASDACSERWQVSKGQVDATIIVPRCSECARAHRVEGRAFSVRGASTGAAVGLFLQLWMIGAPPSGRGAGLLAAADVALQLLFDRGGAFAALGLGLLGGRLLFPVQEASVKPRASAAECDELRDLAADGWTIAAPSAARAWRRIVVPLAAVSCIALAALRIEAGYALRRDSQAAVMLNAATPAALPVFERAGLPPGLGDSVLDALNEGDAIEARRIVENAIATSTDAVALPWLGAYLDAVIAGDHVQAQQIARTGFAQAVSSEEPLRETLAALAEPAVRAHAASPARASGPRGKRPTRRGLPSNAEPRAENPPTPKRAASGSIDEFLKPAAHSERPRVDEREDDLLEADVQDEPPPSDELDRYMKRGVRPAESPTWNRERLELKPPAILELGPGP